MAAWIALAHRLRGRVGAVRSTMLTPTSACGPRMTAPTDPFALRIGEELLALDQDGRLEANYWHDDPGSVFISITVPKSDCPAMRRATLWPTN